MHIIRDSAEHMREYLDKHGIVQADYIISGLPFASLPAYVMVWFYYTETIADRA